MLKFGVLGISILFASLFSFFGGKEDPYKEAESRMNRTINHSIKQLSQRYGLKAIGTGGSHEDKKSKMEAVSFNLYRNITKDEARILLVETVELFLHNINGNKELSDFLYDKPFTFRNLELVIFIYNKNGSDTFHPEQGLVSLTSRGTVNFVTYVNSEICKRFSNLEETYEEAYKIVTQGNNQPS